MGWREFRDKYVTGGVFGNTPDRVKKEIETIKKFGEDITGKTGERAASEAARTEAEAMTQQLNYLKEINRLPQELKEKALTELAGAVGIGEGGFTDRYKESPMYQSLMRGREAGEEAIMRGASTTGGLRSGNVQEALYDYNVGLERQGYGEYMQGLRGLAQLPTMEQQIGQTYGDIGRTQAAGILGAAQSRQAGTANLINLGLGLGGLGLEYSRL